MLAPRIVPPPVEWLDLFLRSSHRRQYPAKTTIIHEGLSRLTFASPDINDESRLQVSVSYDLFKKKSIRSKMGLNNFLIYMEHP